MCRDVACVWGALFWMVLGLAGTLGAAAGAAEPFGLPACTADFSEEVVLNTALIEAMLTEAEPSGAQPNRQHEMLLIVTKHYLQRSEGLLVLSRTAMDQPPMLLQPDCLPYATTAAAHAPLADLTLEQKQALITYYDLVVGPRGSVVSQRLEENGRPVSENMARVPAGAFTRGNGKRVDLETFAIDVYEVTNAEYRQFLEAQGYETQAYWSEAGWRWVQEKSRRQPSYWDDERLRQPEQPVVGVTWYEADAYCRWAGKVLPEELQWEKACRSTDGRKFPWGDVPPPVAEETQKQLADLTSYAGPAAVGSRPETQSPYGVHDLAGNVLEWTATSRDGEGMVLLGGSGDTMLPQVGCGVSHTLLPGISANFIGFRCLTNAP